MMTLMSSWYQLLRLDGGPAVIVCCVCLCNMVILTFVEKQKNKNVLHHIIHYTVFARSRMITYITSPFFPSVYLCEF